MRTLSLIAGLALSLVACASSAPPSDDSKSSSAADSDESPTDCTKNGDKDCASGESCFYTAGGLFTRASYACYDADDAPSGTQKAPTGESSFASGVYLGACLGACSQNYASDPSGLSACQYACAATQP